MKKATLARAFSALRAERELTLSQVANECGLAQTTVLKIESGKPVRWETLHLILSVGFQVLSGTEKYELFHRLWIMHRAEIAEAQPSDASSKKLSKHAAAAVKKFRESIRDLNEEQLKRVMEKVKESSEKEVYRKRHR